MSHACKAPTIPSSKTDKTEAYRNHAVKVVRVNDTKFLVRLYNLPIGFQCIISKYIRFELTRKPLTFSCTTGSDLAQFCVVCGPSRVTSYEYKYFSMFQRMSNQPALEQISRDLEIQYRIISLIIKEAGPEDIENRSSPNKHGNITGNFICYGVSPHRGFSSC